jgi:hypothetical protein
MSHDDMREALELLAFGADGRLPATLNADAARFDRETRGWRLQPEVQGFGLAQRTVCGRPTGERTLKVYVAKKRPRAKVQAPVPPTVATPWGRLPIDVEQVGRLVPQSGATVGGGSGIRHRDDPQELGTLGCLVRKRSAPDQVFLLSCSHVIALSGVAKVGDPILRIGKGDPSTDAPIATLTDWYRFTDAMPNAMDAAIALVTSDSVSPVIDHFGLPTGIGYFVTPGMSVQLSGAKSGFVGSTIWDDNFILQTDITLDGGSEPLRFRDQVSCDVYTTNGDSGAAVLNSFGRVVGLHFYGSTECSVFTPIRPILERFDVDVITTPLTSVPPATGAALLAPPLGPVGFRPPVDDRAKAIDTLARTVWGEARNQEPIGMEAVACCIVNRTKRGFGYWWGDTIERVCLKKWQFSCWNENDPNRAKLLAVARGETHFDKCLVIAGNAVDGMLPDRTIGATHYYAKSMPSPPPWAVGHKPCIEIKDHLFFNDVR